MLEEHTILQKLEQVVLVETEKFAPGVANYSTCVMEAMISHCPNLVDMSPISCAPKIICKAC
jgi:hypothetical protein